MKMFIVGILTWQFATLIATIVFNKDDYIALAFGGGIFTLGGILLGIIYRKTRKAYLERYGVRKLVVNENGKVYHIRVGKICPSQCEPLEFSSNALLQEIKAQKNHKGLYPFGQKQLGASEHISASRAPRKIWMQYPEI